ncbi:MAG: insulinase family protein [Cocleimonas sp.]|nr:insulinase family protein [Cocleimonas sp.]
MSQTPLTVASSFELIREHRIDTLNLTFEEYKHNITGTTHIHLNSEDDNNVFFVAFLTVPQDSSGVAHILEHTSLCGSQRFPVRDPFFMMLRRSLNTFMNAFTSTDWTAYPFATQNRKDFDNLLQIYLDAAFFPNLDYLDFRQEGWRVEFEEADNPDSHLVYKGVVFNEMKGAMSSPISRVWQTLQSALYPDTTYHFNSGGEPSDIPTLSHDDLVAFHKRHYHPSNAIIMTAGDIPASEHQQRIDELALSKFKKETIDCTIANVTRYTQPQQIEATYALDGEEDLSKKTHIVLGWLLGESANLKDNIEAGLLSAVLLNNSASPLLKVLETSDLGTSPSPLCGHDSDMKEGCFACGLEGSEPENADAVEALIMGVLENVAEQGIPKEELESILHQIELSQREVGGSHYPYGLQLIMKAISPALYNADPVAVLDLDFTIKQLYNDIKDPNYIKNITRKLLLDNPHRVRLVMTPDTKKNQQEDVDEAKRLAVIKAAMSDAEKQETVALAAALKARQEQEDDPEILPKVGLNDVKTDIKEVQGETSTLSNQQQVTCYSTGTNGIIYQRIVVEIPPLEQELADLLPLYNSLLTELGIGDKDYLQVQAWQASVTGGIGAGSSTRSQLGDSNRVKRYFSLYGKALERNQTALSELLHRTFFEVRFDELSRIRELIAQMRASQEASITNRGHLLAGLAASAGISARAALANRNGGLPSIQTLKKLDAHFDDETALREFSEKLQQLHQKLIAAPRQFVLVADEKSLTELEQTLDEKWQHTSTNEAQASSDTIWTPSNVMQGWAISTQVNFCSKAYPAAPSGHKDSAALSVLGSFLRNGYLHRTIREQGGAYGGGASYDSDTASFRFYSYRDPRLVETLNDFDKSLEWLLNTKHNGQALEEAILGVVGSIDNPSSPSGEAINTFYSNLHKRPYLWRKQSRENILNVSLDDLLHVGEKYLTPENGNIAIIGSHDALQAADQLALEIHKP